MLYTDTVTANDCGYASSVSLVNTWQDGQAERIWCLGSRVISLKLERKHGGGVWKTVERMPLDRPLPQLQQLRLAGVEHPSSWADTFHQVAPSVRRIKHTYNAMFSWWSGGPWEEALKTGTLAGQWYRYDLVSAYRWAATLGLPNPDTYRVTEHPRKHGVLLPGLWLARITSDRTRLPSAYRVNDMVVVSTEDIETYKLNVDIERGVTWSESFPADYVEHILAKLPYPKEAGRAYWGRWVARDPLICRTKAREWTMQNVFANFVWGWLIVHRVRQRVWLHAREAAHVYVDEVVVPHELPTSADIGAWHLKEMYPDGIIVKRTGWYGGTHRSATMQTGVKTGAHNSPIAQ